MNVAREMVGVFLAVGTSLLANAAKGICREKPLSGLCLAGLIVATRGET
jgi:hypothetical protein